jgi:hypothetical protein
LLGFGLDDRGLGCGHGFGFLIGLGRGLDRLGGFLSGHAKTSDHQKKQADRAGAFCSATAGAVGMTGKEISQMAR